MRDEKQLETEHITLYSNDTVTERKNKAVYSANLMLLTTDNEDFKALQKGINENYRPANQVEAVLVSIIAESTWRLNQISKTEQGLFRKNELENTIKKSKEAIDLELKRKGSSIEMISNVIKVYLGDKENPYFKENVLLTDNIEKLINAVQESETEPQKLATAFHNDATNSETIAKLTRYRKSVEHSLYTAIDKLNNLQKHRLSLELLTAKSVYMNDGE